jgi:hypothetical protein
MNPLDAALPPPPVTPRDITIKFASEEAAQHFALWLCERGEQEYWDWMRYREEEEEGNITATSFEYHGPEDESKAKTDASRYGKFMCDWTIRTHLGRLTPSNEPEIKAWTE